MRRRLRLTGTPELRPALTLTRVRVGAGRFALWCSLCRDEALEAVLSQDVPSSHMTVDTARNISERGKDATTPSEGQPRKGAMVGAGGSCGRCS